MEGSRRKGRREGGRERGKELEEGVGWGREGGGKEGGTEREEWGGERVGFLTLSRETCG